MLFFKAASVVGCVKGTPKTPCVSSVEALPQRTTFSPTTTGTRPFRGAGGFGRTPFSRQGFLRCAAKQFRGQAVQSVGEPAAPATTPHTRVLPRRCWGLFSALARGFRRGVLRRFDWLRAILTLFAKTKRLAPGAARGGTAVWTPSKRRWYGLRRA